jgi:hypothetical protein
VSGIIQRFLLEPVDQVTKPSPELRAMAKRIAAQPRPALDDAAIDEWAARLAADAVAAGELLP